MISRFADQQEEMTMSLETTKHDELESLRKPTVAVVETLSEHGSSRMILRTGEETEHLKFDATRIAWNSAISERIGKDLLVIEASLFETKWFDYRFMHPAAATQLFALRYIEMYR